MNISLVPLGPCWQCGELCMDRVNKDRTYWTSRVQYSTLQRHAKKRSTLTVKLREDATGSLQLEYQCSGPTKDVLNSFEKKDLPLMLKIFSLNKCQVFSVNRHIWVFHVMPICQIIWQILSYTAQNKFRQKLSLVGFELNLQIMSPNWASKESVGDVWGELSFVSCTTSHVRLGLFLESIEHDFIKAHFRHLQQIPQWLS